MEVLWPSPFSGAVQEAASRGQCGHSDECLLQVPALRLQAEETAVQLSLPDPYPETRSAPRIVCNGSCAAKPGWVIRRIWTPPSGSLHFH